MDWLLGRLILEARRRSRAGKGGSVWMFTGVAAWVATQARKRRRRVLFTQVLEPGHRLQLTELGPPPGRRERRRAGRQG